LQEYSSIFHKLKHNNMIKQEKVVFLIQLEELFVHHQSCLQFRSLIGLRKQSFSPFF
jgi:hypothetical protein